MPNKNDMAKSDYCGSLKTGEDEVKIAEAASATLFAASAKITFRERDKSSDEVVKSNS